MQTVQFKYGRVWQLQYGIGDKIIWGRNSIGTPEGKFVVDGAGEKACSTCGCQTEDYYVTIENSVIKHIVPADGTYDFSKIVEGWIDVSGE